MTSEELHPDDIFQCTRCGDCCKGYGGTFMSDADVKSIVAYLKIEPEEFLSTYCRFSGQRPFLAQKSDGYCIFWDGDCRIHPVKPRMCRLWPFIESVLIDIKNWQIMAGMCPGIRSDSPDKVVRECVRQQIEKDNARSTSEC